MHYNLVVISQKKVWYSLWGTINRDKNPVKDEENEREILPGGENKKIRAI